MKSSSAPQENSKNDVEQEDSKTTPTEARVSSVVDDRSSRPSLMRTAPGRLSDISQDLAERKHDASEVEDADANGDSRDDKNFAAEMESTVKSAKGKSHKGSSANDVAKLRDEMNAKLLLKQRTRRSYGTSKPDPSSMRVSPIQEEDAASNSPSLDAQVANPPATTRTNSTMSTESTESTKTIRASKPATPAANAPPRTPSYPFPYVPGTPKAWANNFHQPFTALSPTVSGVPHGEDDTPGKDSGRFSGRSTPAPNPSTFVPPGAGSQSPGDTRFPTPNLYDLVLQLNSEPGLEPWWAMVTNLMHDHYKAERVTLVMPLDQTDIENVPWGQKATFSMNGPEEFVPHRTVVEQTLSAAASSNPATQDSMAKQPFADAGDIKPQKLHPERLRPRLEARHSYAGHGRESFNNLQGKAPQRPAGPQRNVTHAAGVPSGAVQGRLPAHRFLSTSTMRQESLGDPDFSSIAGGIDAGPYAEVFSNLRSLDREIRPLIESGGVCRVLDRGRLVTVTRDYVPENVDSSNSNGSTSAISEQGPPETQTARKSAVETLFGNYRSVFASDNLPSEAKDYQEYEQQPPSPWSQSPAPSPAIQSDEETNPFFASEEQQVENSFNPTATPKDYTQFGQVEAIGVDCASTVIHIPLVHPSLSQPMQSVRAYPPSNDEDGPPKRSNTIDLERKAPIAILSILSSTVPYPHNLAQSLKLLGPHLATSFAVSQQFSSTHAQAISIRHRRTASGHNITNAPMTIEPTSLEDVASAEIEGAPRSISDSMTSPSEYSGRSTHSPSGSIVGTPGWDPATHGWASNTGTEMIDNYFEAKKRSGQQVPPARPNKKYSGSESKTSVQQASPPDEDAKSPQSDRKRAQPTSPQRPPLRQSISEITESSADKRHSQLHSYGADFNASFGELASSTIEPRTPGGFGHARKPSYPEDMPPPSERLLRTIIDSVPVQIFTAEPETGRLTWVNSKFLIYRAQEARQVLDDPWKAVHPDDRDEFMSAWHRSLRTTQQLQQKIRLERFDRTYRWFYVRAAPLKDKRHKIVHWIGTKMDFHEQHIAEMNSARQQETAASEAKYRALANSSPQVVFAVSRARGVTFCNSRWTHFSGQSEAQALGVGFMDHVHPDDLAKCKLPTFDEGSSQPKNVPTSVPPELNRKYSASAASTSSSSETEKGGAGIESSPVTTQMPQRKLSELASTGILKVTRDASGTTSYATEVRLKSRDGEYRWHLVRVLLAEPLLQSGHEEETWYGTCTDINDHKQLERDLKETMDEKSRFLSNMSHEIRTPLNGIIGMVNFLIDTPLTPDQMEHVNIIRGSTEGLRGLINDILDLSKAEAGMINLNMDWLYVRALIEEVNDLMSTMAIDKSLELNYTVEDDVPSQIKGDRFRIRQILLNIIGNAIKFTERGEVFVRCSTSPVKDDELARNETYIKFEVIDTGRGFTEQEAAHLFLRFSQIDGSSTRQHGGTGLGLVISQQLAQLHGGDMSAKGTPGKGSTFTLTIKTSLPSESDQPPLPPPTPGASSIPVLPVSPGPAVNPSTVPKMPLTASRPMPTDTQARPSPKFALEYRQSPSPYMSPDIGRESPAASSASSDPSVRSAARTSSLRSERSSASSFMPEPAMLSQPMKLALPNRSKGSGSEAAALSSRDSTSNLSLAHNSYGTGSTLATADGSLVPPMYSILVLCPLTYSREATVQHINNTLPENIPHQITARESLAECEQLITGENAVTFTHIVVMLQNVEEIALLVDQILVGQPNQTTCIVIITDLVQRRKLVEHSPAYNYEKLVADRKIQFVFKPLKPSRFAVIFDPQKEREMSTDRNHDSAQQVALTQKQVFEELTGRLGNKEKRVLLVEDNKTNQLVVLKFMSKVSIKAETAIDGVECTDKVFAHPHSYYSIILCDLQMPNKDGYQTCKEIRKWERQNQQPHIPIIALSANVLGDVYQKCVDAGFNSYMTKPVDFKELSAVLMTFMDPIDPSKPHDLMKMKRRQSAAHGR